MDTTVNSLAYWEERFSGGSWEIRNGPRQTAFFGEVLLAGLPANILDEIRRERLSVCDIGSAQGEATALLARHLPGCRVVGSDFSPQAVEKARVSHPGLEFVVEDMTATQAEPFDVLVCSNVLEHFSAPGEVLAAMARRARRMLIIMVPVDDSFGIEEHVFSFGYGNLDTLALNQFELVHARDIDTGLLPDNYWPGRQLLLVYRRLKRGRRGSFGLLTLGIASSLLGDVSASAEAWRARATHFYREFVLAQEQAASRQADIARLQQEATEMEGCIADAQGRARDESQARMRLEQDMAERQAALAQAVALGERLGDDLRAAQYLVLQDRQALEQALAEAAVRRRQADEELLAARAQATQWHERALQAEGGLCAVYNSRSWRITRPLRDGLALLHKHAPKMEEGAPGGDRPPMQQKIKRALQRLFGVEPRK